MTKTPVFLIVLTSLTLATISTADAKISMFKFKRVSRASTVMLNPQPLPPASKVSLNPQPLPPRK